MGGSWDVQTPNTRHPCWPKPALPLKPILGALEGFSAALQPAAGLARVNSRPQEEQGHGLCTPLSAVFPLLLGSILDPPTLSLPQQGRSGSPVVTSSSTKVTAGSWRQQSRGIFCRTESILVTTWDVPQGWGSHRFSGQPVMRSHLLTLLCVTPFPSKALEETLTV